MTTRKNLADIETTTSVDFLQKRWGNALNGGLLILPTVLLRCQSQLAIDSTSMVILMNLLAAWGQDEHATMDVAIVAEHMHLPATALLEKLQNLERFGFIRSTSQIAINGTLAYDLGGLVGILKAAGIDSVETP